MTHFRLSALGMINAQGANPHEIFSSLLKGKTNRLAMSDQFVPGRFLPVGAVRSELPAVSPEHALFNSRNSRLLLAAYIQIADAVERCKKHYGADRIAVIVGSSTSGIANAEDAVKFFFETGTKPSSYHYAQQEIGSVSEYVALISGARGPSYTISTACSSSAKVFASARACIETGFADAVIVGGADSLCALTLQGFAALGLLSDTVCNPMSANRNGINIGEGAALFLLEAEVGGIQLSGIGESSDAYHISTPDPSAAGATRAMKQALNHAQLATHKLSYINLHGTGTVHNDKMESRAISSTCEKSVLCSSTKPMTGHTLGASGAIEVGILWLILNQNVQESCVPPHCWDGIRDPDISFLQLATHGTKLAPDAKYMMSTSFGFGGSNCAVILGRTDP